MALRRFRRVPTAPGATVVLGLCASVWLAMDLGVIAPATARHLLHLPVVLAAARFGPRAGMSTALVATALIEPLGSGTPVTTWFASGGLYVLVGWAVGSVSPAQVDEVAREREPVERGCALAGERRVPAQLVSPVPHGLRTPLTVIRGSVDTLLVRHPAGQAQQDLLQATARATVRLEEKLDVVLAAADRFDQRPSRHGQLELGPPRQLELGPPGQLELGELARIEPDVTIRRAAPSIHGGLDDRPGLPRGTGLAPVRPHLWTMLRSLPERVRSCRWIRDRGS